MVRVKQAEVSESMRLVAPDTSIAVGDITEWLVPDTFAGKDVTHIAYGVFLSGTGDCTFQVRKKKLSDDSEVDLLTTLATIESGERHSSQATAPAIDSSESTLAEGDILIFEVATVGATPPKGLYFSMTCR